MENLLRFFSFFTTFNAPFYGRKNKNKLEYGNITVDKRQKISLPLMDRKFVVLSSLY